MCVCVCVCACVCGVWVCTPPPLLIYTHLPMRDSAVEMVVPNLTKSSATFFMLLPWAVWGCKVWCEVCERWCGRWWSLPSLHLESSLMDPMSLCTWLLSVDSDCKGSHDLSHYITSYIPPPCRVAPPDSQACAPGSERSWDSENHLRAPWQTELQSETISCQVRQCLHSWPATLNQSLGTLCHVMYMVNRSAHEKVMHL